MVDDNVGAVLIYSRVQGIWSLQDTINPSYSYRYRQFGFSLAFSKDGILYVGANGYGK